MKLFFTPLALSDLHQILDHISEVRPLTAKKVLARIRLQCELLRTQPHLGQLRPEFPGNYRSFPVERWVIFYRVASNAVEIHRVIDGARDIDSLMR